MKINCKVRIGLYPFKIVSVDKEEIQGNDGLCLNNDRIIKIRNDLDDIATELVLRHEIVHAILCTQGRVYQRKFSVEEVCEFISYKLPEIEQICEIIMKGEK